MTRKLQTGRREAQSGSARSVVVFLHGYGADGADLLGLAEPMAPYLPDTVFLAPDAPEPCRVNPMGRQWFPIPWLDGSSEVQATESLLAAVADLDAFLDEAMTREGVATDRLAVVGFSQGTMMALHVLPRRPAPVAAIVGFSGRLLAPERLEAEVVSRPPVLLMHGDRDEVVPPASMPEAEAALRTAGFAVDTHVMAGMGHGISPEAIGLALAFLRDNLGRPPLPESVTSAS